MGHLPTMYLDAVLSSAPEFVNFYSERIKQGSFYLLFLWFLTVEL